MSEGAALDAVPVDADLPGRGWMAVDEGFSFAADEGGPGDLLDCVGPSFPDRAVVATAASPHFIRLPRALVHGIGVAFDSAAAAEAAAEILETEAFAACLGRSVAADLAAQPIDTEVLAVDVARLDPSTVGSAGHRVRFTGGDEHGVRPVVLDIVVVRGVDAIGLLWFGDTPSPFTPADRDHVVDAVSRRLGRRSGDGP